MSGTALWTAVIAGSLGCYVLKLAGLSVPAAWRWNSSGSRYSGSANRVAARPRCSGVRIASASAYARCFEIIGFMRTFW